MQLRSAAKKGAPFAAGEHKKLMGLLAARGRKKKEADDIPMAAMPDIAFLLLMFFMVSTTFLVSRTLNVELPAYTKEQPKKKVDRMTVFLADDSLRVEFRDRKENIDMWELEGRVHDILLDSEGVEQRVVLLEVDDDCSYQRVIEAFDGVRSADGYVTLVEPEAAKE